MRDTPGADEPDPGYPSPERSPSERLADWARGRRAEKRVAREAAARDAEAHRGGEPPQPFDRAALLVAPVAFGGYALFALVWGAVHDAPLASWAYSASWPLVGLAFTVALGRRWSGVWTLWLLWAVPMFSLGVEQALSVLLTRSLQGQMDAMAVAGLAAGSALLGAAWRQDRAWVAQRTHTDGERLQGEAWLRVRGAVRAVVVSSALFWAAIVVSNSVIEWSYGVTPGTDPLLRTLSSNGSAQLLLAVAMGLFAYHVRFGPRLAACVFAVAGTYFLALAVPALVAIAITGYRGGEHVVFFADLAVALVRLAWGLIALYAAWRLAAILRPEEAGPDAA